jgi:polysaccharide biosynthesis transport protein
MVDMLREPNLVDLHDETPSGKLLVHVLMQFLFTVRYRKNVVIAALICCGVLGGLYYATATRYYRAKAGLLMIQTEMSENESTARQLFDQRSLMKTFESVARSPKVLEAALAKLSPQDRIDLNGVPKQAAVAVLKANFSTDVIPTTNILEFRYRSKDPVVAVNVLNAIIDAYIEFLDNTHKGTAAEISRVLIKERTELTQQLQQKQDELVRARAVFGDLNSTEKGEVLNPIIKRAIYFTDELNQVQRKRIELQASLATIQSAIRNGEDLRQHLVSAINAVGNELMLRSFGLSASDTRRQNDLVESLLADQAELRAMQGCLGQAHPQMVAKREKVRLTEQYLREYQQRSAETVAQLRDSQLGPMLVQMVQQRLSETMEQERALRSQFEASRSEAVELNSHLATLEILKHDVQRLRDLGDVLVKQIASMDLKQDGQEIRAIVIDQPVPVKRATSPRLPQVILLVLAGGFGLGLIAVYVLDVLDDRFRSVEDMQRQLGVPVLSMVRHLNISATAGLDSLQAHLHPASAESEAFRTLRAALALTDEHLRRLVVTSSEPGDGKTTVLANLAVCYAQSGKKTLLIDADMRRPGLTNLLEMRQLEGLSSVLRRESVAADSAVLIQASGIENLDVLPCGMRPTNPAELLASAKFAELIDWAASVYDRILIDSPPALATSDAAVLGRQVDGVVMVVQPDKNRRRTVVRAVNGLLSLRIPLLGLVVNRVGSDNDRGYYGRDYGYGYGYGYNADDANNEDVDPLDDDLPVAVRPRRAA